jgi:hypothetical protein
MIVAHQGSVFDPMFNAVHSPSIACTSMFDSGTLPVLVRTKSWSGHSAPDSSNMIIGFYVEMRVVESRPSSTLVAYSQSARAIRVGMAFRGMALNGHVYGSSDRGSVIGAWRSITSTEGADDVVLGVVVGWVAGAVIGDRPGPSAWRTICRGRGTLRLKVGPLMVAGQE